MTKHMEETMKKYKSILITGGTGSFGKQFIKTILSKNKNFDRIIIFSRDELKQHEMRISGLNDSRLRYFIGDVRDLERLRRAMYEVDIVVHAAALKQVPACEYNPIEAVLTNVMGARNIIDAALDNKVKKVIALSTDKAVNPINLYGATKLVAEKLFIQANSYSGDRSTRFSCVRYGNVIGSRGSVIPLFKLQKKDGVVTVTDPHMTRFWITLDQGVGFVNDCIKIMCGGEVFIPKIPSAKIIDLVKIIAPSCKIKNIGMRPGEKLHEVLISEDESRFVLEFKDKYVIQPNHPWWEANYLKKGKKLPEGFIYSSNKNIDQLSLKDIEKVIKQFYSHE
jgi:UDP-N-acetylglucosamine 4,6-dehydratase/5-epimerase